MKSVPIRSFSGSLFPRIRTGQGEILRISPYSVKMRENTDQEKNYEYGHLRSTQGLQYYLKKRPHRMGFPFFI